MFDWVFVFVVLVVSTMVTFAWSVLDRRRMQYDALYAWDRLFIRFMLAGQFLSYGMSKAIPIQMPFTSLSRFVQPYGTFSQMGVMWSSIGAAPAYEIFAGCVELLAVILLLSPRTTMLGALIRLADMTQVFMLNMTYDVPVKLLSFHLLLLCVFLLAPDCVRLVGFFFC